MTSDLTDVFMKTIAVDFDGVIHRYSEGWKDGDIYDPPVPGAFDALRKLLEDYYVFIFTTRNTMQIAEWLEREGGFKVTTDDSRFKHDLVWDGSFWGTPGVLLVTNQKLGAFAYIDDRAIRFRGDWRETLTELKEIESGL